MCGPPSGTEKAVVVTAFAIHGGKDCSREAAVIRRSRKGCGPQGGERGRVAQDVLASPRSGPLPPLPQQEGLFLALSLYRKDAVLKFNRRPSTKRQGRRTSHRCLLRPPPAWWAPLSSALGTPSSSHALPRPACLSQGRLWVKAAWAVTCLNSYGLGPKSRGFKENTLT